MVTSSASSTQSYYSTQPASPCFNPLTCTLEQEQEQVEKCKVEHSFPDSITAWTNENHEHIRECVTARHNSPCESEQKQVKCKVKHSFQDSNATWTNKNGELQRIDCLCLDIDMDTLTTNKAMFKLSCSIFLKKKDNNKLSIYLFILPPSINTVKLENDGGRVSLHFYMDQFKQNALLVVPSSGDGPLIPKGRSEQLLNLMRALSLVKDFTIQLGNTDISESTKLELDHVASVFSPNHQPLPEPIKINLKSLYRGKGGEIVNAVTAPTSVSSEAGPPPPYPSSKRKKRKHSSISGVTPDPIEEFESSIEAGLDGITSDVESDSRETLKSSMEARLARMEARLADTEASLADTKARLEKVINRVKNMKTNFMSDLQAVREQYREKIGKRVNQLLEEFLNSTRLDDEVDERLDDRIDGLRTEIHELFHDKESEFEQAMEEHSENRVKKLEEMIDMKMEQHMEELLPCTKWEISFNKKE